jgi:hypothetical protein
LLFDKNGPKILKITVSYGRDADQPIKLEDCGAAIR